MSRAANVVLLAILFASRFASAGTITEPVGSFSYSYNSQNDSNTGTADPNATLGGSAVFGGDGINNPYGRFYQSPQGTSGTVTYTFAATPGDFFSGNANIFSELGMFNGGGSGSVSLVLTDNLGANATLFTATGNTGNVGETNTFDVTGANSFTLTYTIINASGDANGDIADQLFRQTNLNGPNSGNLSQTPFVVSGTVVTPEPSSLILCGLGVVGLLVAARRRRRA